jgi:hypothetical protein
MLTKANHGWISYKVLIDQKPSPVQKTTYFIRVPGENLVVGAGYYDDTRTSQGHETKPKVPGTSVIIEEFVKIEGLLHGIVFGENGHMYVGRNGKEILKISPDGTVILFADIKEADGHFIEGPGHTFLYDMEFDSQGLLYAAAEDRILRISEDGKTETLVEQKFSGNWGACGIALDQKGGVYYSYDNKIMKLNPDGKNELFLDGGQTSPSLKAIVGIEFSPDDKHLFACDGKLGSGKLVKIPVLTSGEAGPMKVIYRDDKLNTEYIAFDRESNLVIKGPWSASFIRVTENGEAETFNHVEIGYGIQTIARGGKGFDTNAIFGTHMPVGVIYKIVLP